MLAAGARFQVAPDLVVQLVGAGVKELVVDSHLHESDAEAVVGRQDMKDPVDRV